MKAKNDQEKKRADGDQSKRSGLDRDFYDWTFAQRLGAPLDYWITDVDGVIRDRAGNLQLLEIKRKDAQIKPHQARTIAILDALIKAGIKATGGVVEIEIGGKCEKHRVNYHGARFLQLSRVSFFDSEFKLNGKPITAQELTQILSFEERNQSATGSPESYEKPEKDATY